MKRAIALAALTIACGACSALPKPSPSLALETAQNVFSCYSDTLTDADYEECAEFGAYVGPVRAEIGPDEFSADYTVGMELNGEWIDATSGHDMLQAHYYMSVKLEELLK